MLRNCAGAGTMQSSTFLACLFAVGFASCSYGLSNDEYQKGLEYLRGAGKSQWQKALKIGQSGLAKAQQDWQSMSLIGTYYERVAKSAQASEMFSKAIGAAEKTKAGKADLADLYAARANNYLALREWKRALADARTACAIEANTARAHYIMGYACQNLGAYSDALREYEMDDKAAGPSARTAMLESECLLKMNRFSDSLRLAESALEKHPKDERLLRAKISSLIALHRTQEAEEQVEVLCRTMPALADFYPILIGDFRKSGQFALALRACSEWIKYCSNGYAYSIRADINHKAGNDEQALKDLAFALQKEPNNLYFHDCRGRLLERLGRLDQSKVDYDFILNHKSGEAKTLEYGNHGLIYYRMGKWQAAIDDFDKFLKIRTDPFILSLRIRCCMNSNQDTKALSDLDKFLSLKPRKVEFRAMRAEIMEKRGKYANALEDMNVAILVSKYNPAHYLQRARILKKLGRDREAQQDLIESKHLKELDKSVPP